MDAGRAHETGAGRKLRLLLAHAAGAGRKLRLLLAHAAGAGRKLRLPLATRPAPVPLRR